MNFKERFKGSKILFREQIRFHMVSIDPLKVRIENLWGFSLQDKERTLLAHLILRLYKALRVHTENKDEGVYCLSTLPNESEQNKHYRIV